MGKRRVGSSDPESECQTMPWRRKGANLEQEFIEATPSAELLPLSAGVQDDEADSEMGMVWNTFFSFVLWHFLSSVGIIGCNLSTLTESELMILSLDLRGAVSLWLVEKS
jgi:hypothetical protein